MKKFIIMCLLAAIGTVAFIARGEARSLHQICAHNPQSAQCRHHLHKPPLHPLQQQAPDEADTELPVPIGPLDFPSKQRIYPQYGFGAPIANRCAEFAVILHSQGWQDVKPLRCAGISYYLYNATRDRRLMTLWVSPYSGRVRKIVPAN